MSCLFDLSEGHDISPIRKNEIDTSSGSCGPTFPCTGKASVRREKSLPTAPEKTFQKPIDKPLPLWYYDKAALNGCALQVRTKAARLTLESESINEGEVQEMYAVIVTGGKQYKVCEGDTIYVEKLEMEDGAEVKFETLMTGEDGKINYGTGAVTGEVVKTGKQKKILVFKYKAKKNYRRKQGHRQPYTKVIIKKIEA